MDGYSIGAKENITIKEDGGDMDEESAMPESFQVNHCQDHVLIVGQSTA